MKIEFLISYAPRGVPGGGRMRTFHHLSDLYDVLCVLLILQTILTIFKVKMSQRSFFEKRRENLYGFENQRETENFERSLH